MKVGIICAGDTEVAPFIPIIEECKVTEKAMLKFYEGKINGVEIVTLFCGVCKVNAAIATQILIDTFNVSIVVNSGVAGGMAPELDILDTVISTEVAYHDVADNILTEFHPYLESVYFKADEELVEMSKVAVPKLGVKCKVYWGRMVTGEAFIADDGRDEIIEAFAPLSVDMETASVAHVCYAYKIPFIAIRSITDRADHTGSEEFEKNCEEASIVAKDIVVGLLAEIKQK